MKTTKAITETAKRQIIGHIAELANVITENGRNNHEIPLWTTREVKIEGLKYVKIFVLLTRDAGGNLAVKHTPWHYENETLDPRDMLFADLRSLSLDELGEIAIGTEQHYRISQEIITSMRLDIPTLDNWFQQLDSNDLIRLFPSEFEKNEGDLNDFIDTCDEIWDNFSKEVKIDFYNKNKDIIEK